MLADLKKKMGGRSLFARYPGVRVKVFLDDERPAPEGGPRVDEARAASGTRALLRGPGREAGALMPPAWVYYQADGSSTAAAGGDYQALPGSVTIPAGQTSATVPLTVIDDAAVEDTEAVVVTLSANAGYALGDPSSAVATISLPSTAFMAMGFSQSTCLPALRELTVHS